MKDKKFLAVMIPVLIVIILALVLVWGIVFKLQAENDALQARQFELYLQSEAEARQMSEFGKAFDAQKEEVESLQQEIEKLKESKKDQLRKYEELVVENEEIKNLL